MEQGSWRPQSAQQLRETIERIAKPRQWQGTLELTGKCEQPLPQRYVALTILCVVASCPREHAFPKQKPSFCPSRFSEPQRFGFAFAQPRSAATRGATGCSEPDASEPAVAEQSIALHHTSHKLGQPVPVEQRPQQQPEPNLPEPESGGATPAVELTLKRQQQDDGTKRDEAFFGGGASPISQHHGQDPLRVRPERPQSTAPRGQRPVSRSRNSGAQNGPHSAAGYGKRRICGRPRQPTVAWLVR